MQEMGDPWLPKPISFKSIWVLAEAGRGLTVQQLMVNGEQRCDLNLLRQLFSVEDSGLIRSLPLPLTNVEDKLIWHFSKDGKYSVKTGYEVAIMLKRNSLLNGRGSGEGSSRENMKSFRKDLWAGPTYTNLDTIVRYLYKMCKFYYN